MSRNPAGNQEPPIGIAFVTGLILLSLCLAGCTATAARDQDGWLTERSGIRLTNEMAKKGFMPATIDCRYSSSGPVNLAKFTFIRPPAGTAWRWYVGPPDYVASGGVGAR